MNTTPAALQEPFSSLMPSEQQSLKMAHRMQRAVENMRHMTTPEPHTPLSAYEYAAVHHL
jgi:hypothetical protein